MSEAIEMYLLRIALLSERRDPVPLSQLAEEMNISPVSTNQMCRKLAERGLVDYLPYKGVTLTEEGAVIARRILRKRRLWEVFLVEKLGVAPDEAEDAACRFEHVTPDHLAERLADYLGHPALSPQGQPIPARPGHSETPSAQKLSALSAGMECRILDAAASGPMREFLQAQGLRRGARARVLAVAQNNALLLDVDGRTISLSPELAETIQIHLLD
ncbi:MAG: metal-dependent transcriptional regulator [Chloroflexi bacterium]|nr:metal-dependent transcriptional regulator [Chloroflexota bacterium]